MFSAPQDPVIIGDPDPNTHTVFLNWIRPKEPSRCDINNYYISYSYINCSNGNEEELGPITVPGNMTTYNVIGLQPYWNYTFYIEADTADGLVGDSKSSPSDVRTEFSGSVHF